MVGLDLRLHMLGLGRLCPDVACLDRAALGEVSRTDVSVLSKSGLEGEETVEICFIELPLGDLVVDWLETAAAS